MQIHSFVFNPFFENTYILYNDEKEAIVVDPGCYEPREIDQVEKFINEGDLKVKAIVNTHCHIDHVLGNWVLKNLFQVDLWVPKNEKEIRKIFAKFQKQIRKFRPAIYSGKFHPEGPLQVLRFPGGFAA